MWDWHDGMMSGGYWLIWMVPLMIIFWGGIIALIVWGVKKLGKGEGTTGATKRDPLEIAKERYAKGEISKTDFEQIKKDLS
jgi:putative membrane protein